MNWNNIDLNSEYEREQPVLDPYSVETLLLEISCNLREINEATVKAQYMESLASKYKTAIEIFDSNLTAITKQAIKEREKD